MKIATAILAILLSITTSCKKDDGPAPPPPEPSSENLINSFELNINGQLISGTIDQPKRLITFNTEDADLNAITPTIDFSDKARIEPAPNIAQNFNSEVSYTVYAENGDPNVYRVVVNNQSSAKQILSFQLQVNGKIYEGEVDEDASTIYVETDQRVDSADAVIFVSEGATVSPVKENPQNFYESVEYIVTGENGSTRKYSVTTRAFEFFGNGFKSFYSNAIAGANGPGIDLSIPNSSVILENSQNSYTLEILNSSTSTYSNGMPVGGFSFYFPENIETATDYRLKFLIDGEVKTEANYELDVLAENVPVPISLNQDLYVWNDVLTLTGENLPDTISIPSNGSLFIIKNSNSYDLEVNDERTELTLTLDYYGLFPSYYARPQEEKTITLYGPGLRVGTTIQAVFD